MLTFRQAEILVNEVLVDTLRRSREALGADLSNKEQTRINRAVEKYLSKLGKLRTTLEKNASKDIAA